MKIKLIIVYREGGLSLNWPCSRASSLGSLRSSSLMISSASEKFNTWSPRGIGWTETQINIRVLNRLKGCNILANSMLDHQLDHKWVHKVQHNTWYIGKLDKHNIRYSTNTATWELTYSERKGCALHYQRFRSQTSQQWPKSVQFHNSSRKGTTATFLLYMLGDQIYIKTIIQINWINTSLVR